MPLATARPERRALARGVVGDFVFVDCELFKLLGRIIEIRIPDTERLKVEPTLGEFPVTHPVGRIQLLATVDQSGKKLLRGLRAHPRIGDAVYVADPEVFGQLISNAITSPGGELLDVGLLDVGTDVRLRLQPERVFGRHCGIFGATGGGKSWTLASLIQEIKRLKGKAILFDATGEFGNLSAISSHYAFDTAEPSTAQIYFPYRKSTEEDLFALFRPSGQSQGPKLREAIRSLKLVKAVAGTQSGLSIYEGRTLNKQNKPRAEFLNQSHIHRASLNDPHCDFEIDHLSDQIRAECVYSTGAPGNFGGPDQQALGYCETLIARIRTLVHSGELACLFAASGTSLAHILEQFVASESEDIIRISFKNVRFEHNTREILMNIIGRFLLGHARAGLFRDKPLIVVLDEAHQFLGRTIGDEYVSARLESFGLLAKEGRKHGLTCVLATQRPRDIPPMS